MKSNLSSFSGNKNRHYSMFSVLSLAAVVLAVAIPGPNSSSDDATPYYKLKQWEPAGPRILSTKIDNYEIILCGGKGSARRSIEVLQNGRRVYADIDDALYIERGINGNGEKFAIIGKDITGNRLPDLVVADKINDDLWRWTVLELGRKLRKVAQLSGAQNSVEFRDVNNDGCLEAIIERPQAIEGPKIVLRYSEDRFRSINTPELSID